MLTYIDTELNRNSGRIRHDYVQRLERSVAGIREGNQGCGWRLSLTISGLCWNLEPRTRSLRNRRLRSLTPSLPSAPR